MDSIPTRRCLRIEFIEHAHAIHTHKHTKACTLHRRRPKTNTAPRSGCRRISTRKYQKPCNTQHSVTLAQCRPAFCSRQFPTIACCVRTCWLCAYLATRYSNIKPSSGRTIAAALSWRFHLRFSMWLKYIHYTSTTNKTAINGQRRHHNSIFRVRIYRSARVYSIRMLLSDFSHTL